MFSERLCELLADEALAETETREAERRALDVCLEKLPARQRQWLSAAYQPGVKFREVAQTSGKSVEREQHLPVGHRGIPLHPGAWGGDFSRITGREQGIVPKDGRHMLRFLRSDFEGEVSQWSYRGNVFQVVDLRPWNDLFRDGRARVELTAGFNAVPSQADEEFRFGAQLFALEKPPEEIGASFSSTWLYQQQVAASGQRSVWADDDPATWQVVDTELKIPPQTQFLVVHVEVARIRPARSAQPVEFAGHYVDAVELVLHTERNP